MITDKDVSMPHAFGFISHFDDIDNPNLATMDEWSKDSENISQACWRFMGPQRILVTFFAVSL